MHLSSVLIAGASLIVRGIAVSTYSASALVPFIPKNTTSVDQGQVFNGIYYLSDRVNGALHVIDIASATQISSVTGFKGLVLNSAGKANTTISGPNGVLVLPNRNEVYVGDAAGKITVVSTRNYTVVANIMTGSATRADEMAYDPVSGIVVCTNPDEDIPYMSVVNATSRNVLGRIMFPDASGLEQPAFNAATGTFYATVPSTDANPGGEIVALNIANMSMGAIVPLSQIVPAGIVFGPNQHLFVSASGDQISTYNTSRSVVLDMTTGKVIANISGVAGVDQVAYDPTTNLYYASAYQNRVPPTAAGTPQPILAIIDAATNTVIQTIMTDNVTAHSVAVDPTTNKVLVPLVKGGIQIYSLSMSTNTTNTSGSPAPTASTYKGEGNVLGSSTAMNIAALLIAALVIYR